MDVLRRLVELFRQETILCVAAVLALLSMAVVPPDGAYAGYIDLRVLALLFSLMTVTSGLKCLGVLDAAAGKLLRRAADGRKLCAILVFLCFFSSMLLTNDVSLVTFVPLAVTMLTLAGLEDRLLTVVILQTVAANLGSMLTPIGNPQNLYLYAVSGMDAGTFLALMLPLTAVSGLLLVLCCLVQKPVPISLEAYETSRGPASRRERIELGFFWGLLALCLLAVFRVLPWGVPLAVALVGTLILDRRVLGQVDYGLLVTFVAFFVLIGNLGRMESVRGLLSQVLEGRELITAFLCSQVVSNVPTAVLLAGFTDQWEALLKGTNIGGLGTLIASMASLISYKLFVRARPAETGKYLLCFTVVNIVFAVLLLAVGFLL